MVCANLISNKVTVESWSLLTEQSYYHGKLGKLEDTNGTAAILHVIISQWNQHLPTPKPESGAQAEPTSGFDHDFIHHVTLVYDLSTHGCNWAIFVMVIVSNKSVWRMGGKKEVWRMEGGRQGGREGGRTKSTRKEGRNEGETDRKWGGGGEGKGGWMEERPTLTQTPWWFCIRLPLWDQCCQRRVDPLTLPPGFDGHLQYCKRRKDKALWYN